MTQDKIKKKAKRVLGSILLNTDTTNLLNQHENKQMFDIHLHMPGNSITENEMVATPQRNQRGT